MSMLAAERFEVFGTSHLAVLAICVGGIPAVILLGRRVRGTEAEARANHVFAVLIVAVTVPLQILLLLPGEWSLRTSLPLQLCDLAWMFAVHSLWTRSSLSATVTYLWGVALTTQAMITPDFTSEFPSPRFLMFWSMHILVIWVAFYLVAGLRILPSWMTYWRTVAITAAWAVLMMIFNTVADTNYGYLNGKPASASILDLLGPWPYYIAAEIALIAAVWALMTWPWARQATRRETTAAELP